MPGTKPEDMTIQIPTNEELEAVSAYGGKHPQKKKTKSNKDGSSALRRNLEKSRNEVAILKERERTRKESTPTVYVGTDSIDLVYTGKVAGKSATRQDPILSHPEVQSLIPILTPIVSVMNAALRAQTMDERPVINRDTKRPAEVDGRPVLRANAKSRADYAYSALLNDPEFCQKLDELNAVIAKVYTQLGCEPGKLRSYTKLPTRNHPRENRYSDLNSYVSEIERNDLDSGSLSQ